MRAASTRPSGRSTRTPCRSWTGCGTRGSVPQWCPISSWDIRTVLNPAGAKPDYYALSYEIGATKPDLRISEAALGAFGVEPREALMVGDSEENDGAAEALGCAFALVDPLPIARRPRGRWSGLRVAGVTL